MDNWLNRTELLIGKTALQALKNSTVAVFGIGGVGSYVVEALVRAGIGNLILIDNDVVDVTNINRQLISDTINIGKPKVEVAKKRALYINPNINITIYQEFFNAETAKKLLSSKYNYVADCIDSVSSKLLLIETCYNENIPIISSMGTGNKLNPLQFEVTDINKTSVCPLAKVIRKELKNRNIPHLKVVYSKETPIKIKYNHDAGIIASISFVPSVAGLILASEIVQSIIS